MKRRQVMAPDPSTHPVIGTISDAAGRRVTLLDPAVDWLLGNRERMDQETAERIMTELSGEARASHRLLLGGITVVAGLTIAAAGALAISIAIEGRSAWQDAVGSLVFTAPAVTMMLVAGVVVPIIVARKRRLSRSCEAMLRHGHCPHCGYRIADIPAQAQTGHTICPECGCEWAGPTAKP